MQMKEKLDNNQVNSFILSFNTYNLFHPSSSLLSISIIFPIFATEMKPLTDTQYIRQLVSEGEHCHQDFKFEISDARKIARSLSAFCQYRRRTIVGRRQKQTAK